MRLIIRIIKGIVFGFFILTSLNSLVGINTPGLSFGQSLYNEPGFIIGSMLSSLLLIWLVYYLLYKCKYSLIKKSLKILKKTKKKKVS